MRFLDEWDKKDAQKKRASLPAAQKMPLQPPLLLTKSGVVMADGKGGGRIITPQAGHNTASAAPVVSAVPTVPIVPALPAKSAVQTAGSAGRTATPQKSEAQRRVDNLPNIHAFGAGDYTGAAGLMEKAWQTGKAGVLAVRGAFKEIEGQATPVNREQHLGTFSGFGDLGRAVSESRRTGESIDAITDRLETERLQRREKQRQATYDRASELFEKSAQAQEQAKEGLGTVGRFMVDMGVTGIQMAGDALVNLALPGGGLYMMGLRSYGQAANEARREGKSEEQQFVAGLKSAGIETLTEKMFGAFGKLYGKAGADELVEKLVTKLTGNRTGQALLTWIINSVGEGVEEVTSDLLHPLADRLLKLDDGRGPMFTTDDAAQMGYDFLLGAAMGLVGGTGQLNRGIKQGRAQTAENAYYENLQKNGLFGGNSGQLAQRAIDAMGRAMPGEYAKLPRLVDARGTTYEQQQAVYRGAVPRLKNENGLLSLTEQEKVNLSSGAKNKVVSTFQDAVQFVRNALANRASVERAYMGKVPESTARRVMQETGINIDGMGVMMNSVDVRHIIKSHGDPTLETARGQVMVTAEAIARIPEIIAQPDAVYLSETNDAKGRKAIVFEKRFGDTYITVQGVSNGKNLLQTDTLYIQKGKTRTSRYSMLDVQENAAPEINAQSAPPQGPSYIDTSIPQGTQGVNAQDMRNGVKYAELPRLVDANGMDAQQRTAWLGALEQMPQAQRNQFETAAQIAKRFGAAVQARTMQEGVQGSYQNGVIYIDPAAVDPVRQVMIHELTHHMETSGLYGKFSDAALRFVAEDMGADVDALRRTVIEDYAKAGVALDEDGATRELVAKFAEEKLFTDEATVRRLLAQDRNLFQRIYDWLRDTAAKLTGTPEQRRLIDAQNLYEKALRQAEAGTQDSGTQLLYAGKNAKTADLNALSRAATMEAEGTDAQTIRRETGWFRGMDGKWRFEVDDSGMEYRRDGDARLMEESGYRRLQELTDKWARNAENRGEPLTAEEAAESERLESKYYDRAWAEKYELADFLRHDDLFEAYPTLRHTSVVFKETMPGVNGHYDPGTDTIVLSKDLIGSPESTLVHEIQHIIQGTEEFAGGSNLNYWEYKNKDGQAYKSDRRYLEAERRVRDAFDTMPDTVQEAVRQINRAKLDQDWDAVLRLEESIYNGPYADMYSAYTQADFERRARKDYFNNTTTLELYRNTAGEIEARDAASRRSYNAEQRRQLRPDLGNEATVFTDGGVGYDIQTIGGETMPVIDTQNDTRNYVTAEAYLKTLVNAEHPFSTILVDAQPVYIGRDLPGEYKGSEYTYGMNRALREVKMQAATNLDEMLLLAENGEWRENVKPKHSKDAQNGWYRYETQFAVPVLNAKKAIDHYTVYGGTLLIRNDADGRSYLYDLLDVQKKKVISAPSFSAARRSEVFAPKPSMNSIPIFGGNVNTEKFSTGRSIEEMAGVDTGRTVQETPHNIDVVPFGALGDYEDMPATLRKIGVAPFGAAADYANVENLTKQISGNEQARRQMKKEVSKVPASEKERLFARQLADGTINWEDVPRTVNRSTVELLEDYYRTMDTGTETQLLRDRRDLIFEREEAKMPSLLGMDVRYDEGGLRESGKPSGRVARQVSTLRRNLQTPARVCATEWGQEHGKRVYEALFQPVTENNGRQIDWVNSMLDRVRTFKGADGKARELNRAERDLVQRLVETRAAEARVVKAGDRQQKLAAAEKSAKGEWERAKAAVKGTTVEEYLRQKGYIKDEEETALRHAAFEYWEKRKAGGLENISRDEYIRMAYPALAEYESAKYTGKKEMYKRVVAGDLKSQSAMRVIQEAINGGSRAKAYLDWLGIDWRGYEKAYFSQDAIFKRNTEADNERSKLERAKKTAATAAKQAEAASIETKPFLSAAENIRNGWAAADAAKEFGIDKSQQEYQDLQNYAAYLDAQKQVQNSKNVDAAIVDEAVKTYSTLYQELYDGINTFLAAHGYKPIGFIEGYAPHMQPETAKTAFSKALKMLGLDDTAMMLPTSVSGMTADLKPYKQYDPFFQTRHGDKTEYDIVKGFENYVYYLGNIFYHTDDIMRIRTAAKYIRKTYTSEEASEQINWAENARNFDDAGIEDFLRFNGIIKKGTKLGAGEAKAMLNDYIDGLYEQIGDVSRYSEMVKYLDNYANRLAGKQNMLDRGAEAAAGRRSLNWVNSLLGKYGGAKLAFNVSSALNQTSQLPMVMVENGEITTAKAIRDFFTKSRSDFVQHSNFLKGKKGVDWILGPETGWEKFKEAGFSMTEAVDSFTSYVAVRSKYLKEIRLGASEAEAIDAADEYGRNVMGSRARGEKPMLFDTKNPFWQIATRFQLEAMNSWEHITRDLPAEIRQTAKEKGKLAATGQLAGRAARYTLAAFLINCGIGALSGGSPVPYDILGSAAEAVGEAMGLTKNQAIATLLDGVLEVVFDQRLLGTDEPEDDEEKDWWAALGSLFGNAANDVPILGRAAALAGIGDQTLPTADFSKVGDLVNSARNNGILSTDTLDKALTAGGEFLYGGNQLRKTVQGGMAAAQGGVYSGGKLRYQVERTPWNVGKALLFGRSALDETEEYYAEKRKTFSEKQTTAWEKMQEAGEPARTVEEQRQRAKEGYDLIRQLSSIEKENDDDNRAALQRRALREADVSDEAKAVVWYEMMASEKDQKTMDALKGADMGEVARVLMDMKDRRKDSQKLDIIMSSSLTDDQKGTLYLQTLAGDEDKEKVAVLKAAGMNAYQYLTYKTAISGLSGRTEKLYAIHTMDLSDYQKDALYYLNGWSKKTHDKAPWVQGVSTEAAANRLAMAVIDRESQPEEEPEWKQSLASFLGTGTGSSGNPFLRAMQASSNPFLRATQAEQNNPFLRAMQASGYTSAGMSENPFVRALQKREAAQTAQVENPFVRALQRRG